jgi:hypothetical protein
MKTGQLQKLPTRRNCGLQTRNSRPAANQLWFSNTRDFRYGVKTRIAVQRPNVSFRQLRTCSWEGYVQDVPIAEVAGVAVGMRVTDRSALFIGFTATMAERDFSCPCIIGCGSSRNRCVRFVFGVSAASRNTRFQAAR